MVREGMIPSSLHGPDNFADIAPCHRFKKIPIALTDTLSASLISEFLGKLPGHRLGLPQRDMERQVKNTQKSGILHDFQNPSFFHLVCLRKSLFIRAIAFHKKKPES